MKNINIYIVLATLIGLFGCTDEYEQPYPVSAVSWYTSTPTATEYFVEQEKFLGFMDASVGELSHEWIVEKGNGFLKKGFSPVDSLAAWVDHEVGLTTTEKGVQVYFGKPGRTTLRLRNTFSEKVTYNGVRPIEAVEENGEWVIDTAFVIDVYGPIKPAYNVYRSAGVDENDNPILGDLILEVSADDIVDPNESDTWTSIDVETGEALLFVDLTKEEDENLINPNMRTWTVRNGTDNTTYEDSIATVYFNIYGFQAVGLGNLKAERDVAGSPKSTAQKAIPLKVKVIQSTQPFTYADGAIWTGKTSVSFNVTGEVKSLGDNPETGFTVTVDNPDSGITGKDIAVTGVTVDPTNTTRMSLILAETVYGNDIINVSFNDATANIISKDDRKMESFSDKLVEIPAGGDNEVTDNGGFSGYENSNTNIANAYVPKYWVGGQDANGPEWERVTIKQFEGEASMKYEGTLTPVRPNLGWMHMQDVVDLTPGAYELSHKIFIEPGSTIESIRSYISPKTGGWPTEVLFVWDLTEVKRGEWVTIKQIANFPNQIGGSSAEQYRYQFTVSAGDNPAVDPSDVQVFYLDALKIAVVDAGIRP